MDHNGFVQIDLIFQRKLLRRHLPTSFVNFVSHASAQALRPITFTQRFRTTRHLFSAKTKRKLFSDGKSRGALLERVALKRFIQNWHSFPYSLVIKNLLTLRKLQPFRKTKNEDKICVSFSHTIENWLALRYTDS